MSVAGEFEVLVLGGGVVGLSLARALRRRGIHVAVLERGAVGREASWAAAGILRHADPVLLSGPMRPLADLAMRRYPSWAAELSEETGIDVELDHRGVLSVALHDEDDARIRALRDVAAAAGLAAEIVAPDEARRIEPGPPGTWCRPATPRETRRSIRGSFVHALAESRRRGGVEICEGVRAERIETHGRRRAVLSSGGRFVAERIAVALGAWSATLGIRDLGAGEVVPVRGQILAFRPEIPPRGPVVVRDGHGYLVARRDGKVLAGSTLEPGEWDKHVTLDGARRLTAMAASLVPSLSSAPLVESWAGLRPRHRRELALVGELDGDGIYACTGHYTDGVFLGPTSAELLADLVTTGKTASEIAPLAPAERGISA
ncbi:MAG: FAD-dependent oxidoreductase [Acidobacteriota bacterium]